MINEIKFLDISQKKNYKESEGRNTQWWFCSSQLSKTGFGLKALNAWME